MAGFSLYLANPKRPWKIEGGGGYVCILVQSEAAGDDELCDNIVMASGSDAFNKRIYGMKCSAR